MFSVAGHDIHGISASSSYPVFFFLFYSLAGHGSGTPFLGIVGRKKTIPSHSSPHDRHSILPSLFRDAQVDVSHEGRPWWGSSRPSSRSPTGRGTPLNGVRRRFEACRGHDAWHKAMCKRNIAKYGGIRRPRAKRRRKTWMPRQQQYSKKRITPLEKGCRFS